MKRLLLLITLAFLVAGCGPINIAPMPVRLDEKGQKAIDEAWEKALLPIDRLNHQSLLDVLICTQAYQAGVDKLTFRSEKKVKAGTVIMTINFDRAVPELDLFEVKLVDGEENVLRHERYYREDVENTVRDLNEYHRLTAVKEKGKLTQDEHNKYSELEARIRIVESIYPNAKNGPPENTKK